MHIEKMARLVSTIERITEFIRSYDRYDLDDPNWAISFRDSSGFLGREEAYKIPAAENSRDALKYAEWKKEWIGTGKIAKYVVKAIDQSKNLIYMNSKVDFKNRLNDKHPMFRKDAERVLYDIYCGNDDATAFRDAMKVFGKKYPTIAFLFFGKDYSKYLPISPENMDESFSLLGIDFKTSYRCSWENYCEYIEIIREIKEVMAETLTMNSELWLIDAHSFVWIIHEERFRNWKPTKEQEAVIEKATEDSIDRITGRKPKRVQTLTTGYVRNTEIAKSAKLRAKGICQLCEKPAPFLGRDGNPYLEAHHILWISREGEDSLDNVAALCPNCHTKMHIVDDPKDVEKLRRAVAR